MIRPGDVIASASITEHCRRAEQYFQQVEEPDRLLDKPFVSLNETPLLLYRLGLLLRGLKVAPTMRVLDFGAGTCWVSGILSGLQCHVVCVDPSETALALGRRLFESRPQPDGLDPPEFLRFDGETLLAAAESGFETWLGSLHSFHGRSTFVLQKGRYQPDSRLAEGLAGELEISQHEFEVRAGEPLVFDVAVRNIGRARWLARNSPDIGAVKIGAKIVASGAPAAPPEVQRTSLPHGLDPGRTFIVPVEVRLSEVGAYGVTLDLLDEQVVWFETLGLTPSRLHVSVLPRPSALGTEPEGQLRPPYACNVGPISSKRLTGFSVPETLGAPDDGRGGHRRSARDGAASVPARSLVSGVRSERRPGSRREHRRLRPHGSPDHAPHASLRGPVRKRTHNEPGGVDDSCADESEGAWSGRG